MAQPLPQPGASPRIHETQNTSAEGAFHILGNWPALLIRAFSACLWRDQIPGAMPTGYNAKAPLALKQK
jgi:hypothetical protein